jgi:hypothetical protein
MSVGIQQKVLSAKFHPGDQAVKFDDVNRILKGPSFAGKPIKRTR